MDAVLSKVIDRVNGMFEHMKQRYAIPHADLFWKEKVLKSDPTQWHVRDTETASKGFFSSGKEPTTRTVILTEDITAYYDEAWKGHTEVYTDITKENTFCVNYIEALKEQLSSKVDPKKKDSLKIVVVGHDILIKESQKRRLSLRVEYSYPVQ
jgi:hypothetical protein